MSLLFNMMKINSQRVPGALGRWNTIVNLNTNRDISKDIEKNCDWANSDNCGGELCKPPIKQPIKKDEMGDIYPMIVYSFLNL